MDKEIWQGNRIKHESNNPFIRFILNKFHSDVYKIISSIPCSKILEIGCGEGFVTKFLADRLRNSSFESIDIEPEYILYANKNNNAPNVSFKVMDLFKLKYLKNSFDVTICLEVLEHFKDPNKIVENILNYTKDYALFSVPNEPFFSIANIFRLKYLKTFGNPPIHIQKWNTKKFKSFIEKYGEITKFKTSTFWNIALVKKFS